MTLRIQLGLRAAALAASAVALGACSLIFPSGEYVSAFGDGGAGGDGGSGGGTTSSGGGGAGGGAGTGGSEPGETVARVFVAFGDRDKPPEIPGSFETKVFDVHYADIGDDGVIRSWRNTVSTPLRGLFHLGYYGGALVAFGRALDLESYNRAILFRAPLGPDGLPSAWTAHLDSTSLTYGSREALLGPKGGYLLGGYSSSWPDGNGGTTTRYFETTEFVPGDVDTGTLSPRVEGGNMTVNRRNPGALIRDDVLYTIGGYGGSPLYKSDVEYSTLDTDGVPGEFMSLGQLPGEQVNTTLALLAPALCADETHLFVVGGTLSSGSPSDLVLSARFEAGGSLGDFQHVTKLPTPLANTRCFTHGGRVYVVGGQGVSARSERVLMNDVLGDGLLGASWDGTSNASLPFGRSGMAVAVVPAAAASPN